jgi:hypothetical protein
MENLPEVDTIRSRMRGSILNRAARMSHDEVATELLMRVPETEAQEYVNLSCDLGTPLYCAASRGAITIMQKLVERGAHINLVGGPLGSPLITACSMGQMGAAAWPLKRGAELPCKKLKGTTITTEEAAKQHENVLSLLQKFKEKGTEALDEDVLVKTADISRLDEFMVGFKERKKKKAEAKITSTSDIGSGSVLKFGDGRDQAIGDEKRSEKDDEKGSENDSDVSDENTTKKENDDEKTDKANDEL